MSDPLTQYRRNATKGGDSMTDAEIELRLFLKEEPGSNNLIPWLLAWYERHVKTREQWVWTDSIRILREHDCSSACRVGRSDVCLELVVQRLLAASKLSRGGEI